MSKLGLILSTSRYSRHLLDRVFADAAEHAENDVEVEICVLYVIEIDQLEKIAQQVGGSGFLGSAVQKDVFESLQTEHHRMALQRISEVKERSQKENYAVFVEEKEGNFITEVLAFAEKQACDVIYLTREDKPFISRFLFGSEADKIARLVKQEGFGEVIIDQL